MASALAGGPRAAATASPVRLLQRACSVLLAFLLAFSLGVPATALAAEDGEKSQKSQAARASESANHHQLVLLVRFSDSRNSDGTPVGEGATGMNAPSSFGSATKWQDFEGLLQATDSTIDLALSAYVDVVTGGKVKLANAFPQRNADGATVAYLTLPQTRDHYAKLGLGGSSSIAADAFDQFAKAYPDFDASGMDGNGDGYLDNLLLLVETNGVSSQVNEPWWPHESELHSQKIAVGSGAKRPLAGTYVTMGTDQANNRGVVCHEFLHSLGAKDLYRSEQNSVSAGATGGPVGMWDIMAASTSRRWPLAITRENMGVEQIPRKEAKKATYTLSVNDDDKRNWCTPPAFKVYTSASSTECFVFEYRRRASGNAGLDSLKVMDTTLPNSGLVVYRVNERYSYEGNKGSEGDYAYVFRPGESGDVRGDGAGDLSSAALGLSSFGAKHATMGSLDAETTLSQGAITYASGQNSGIQVKVTAQTDTSITFELDFASQQSMGLWSRALDTRGAATGTSPLPSSGAHGASLATEADSAYVLASTGSFSNPSHQLRAFDGETWRALGAPITGLGDARVAVQGGQPFVSGVVWSDGDNRMVVKRLEGQSWVDAGSFPTGSAVPSAAPAMGVVGGALHVLAASGSSKLQLQRWNGTGFAAVGTPLPVDDAVGNVVSPVVFELGGKPAVACSVVNGAAMQAKAFVWDGSSWRQHVVAAEGAQVVKAACSGNGAYVATLFSTWETSGLVERAKVHKLAEDGSVERSWDVSGTLGSAADLALAVDGGDLYLGIAEGGSPNRARVFRAPIDDPAALIQVDAAVATPASALQLGVAGGRVYAATVDTQGGTVDLRWRKAVGTPGPGSEGGQEQPVVIAVPSAAKGLVYSGSAQTGVPAGTAYALSGTTRATAAGTYRATVTPRAGYAWDAAGNRAAKTITWKIAPASLAKASVTLSPKSCAADGTPKKPAATVKVGGRTLKAGTDFTVAYRNNVNPGTATATVTGKGNYTGSRSATFALTRQSVANATVTGLNARYVYTGSPIAPVATVKLGGKTLRQGVDCTVSFANNVKPGTAVMTIQGKGRYQGTKRVSFQIAKRSLSGASVTLASTAYVADGTAKKPGVTVKVAGRTLKAGTDYTVSYRNNKAAGTATATVSGTGGYAGAVSKTFTIKKAPTVTYRTHVQTYGWSQGWKSDGVTAGTMGQSKRLEAIEVKLANKPCTGGIRYWTHIQTYGWSQGWKSDGKAAGTSGESKRLEAIRIELTGQMAQRYDVYYRVHAQRFGWMGWAKNGASAGTAGFAYRLEGIQIKLVPKGHAAPSSKGSDYAKAFAEKRR